MVIYLSLLVCVAGLLIFLLTGLPTAPPNAGPSPMNMKWNKIGFALFCIGALAFLITYPPYAVHLLRP